MVEGTVRELKDAAPIRHLELELDGDATALFESLDGIRSIEVRRGATSPGHRRRDRRPRTSGGKLRTPADSATSATPRPPCRTCSGRRCR